MKKVIEGFIPQGGDHCITNALKQIFAYYDHPLSEAMLFGLASGLSFVYVNQSTSPMISGRSKVFTFENKLAQRLHIRIACKSGKEYPVVFDKTIRMINDQKPVLIYVDMPYLSYLELKESSHFGGHAVVLFGYDDTEEMFYVSDRDHHDFPIRVPSGRIAQDYHLVPYSEIERARTSKFRPFPASNKYLTFDFSGYKPIETATLYDAIEETCTSMLHAPAHLLGIHGILKFSKEIKKWKMFSPQKLRLAAITNYFQISKDGGTGGGIFRALYGKFLIEASSIIQDTTFVSIGNDFIQVALLWDQVADALWQLSLQGNLELLNMISLLIVTIYETEKQLYTRLLSHIESHLTSEY